MILFRRGGVIVLSEIVLFNIFRYKCIIIFPFPSYVATTPPTPVLT